MMTPRSGALGFALLSLGCGAPATSRAGAGEPAAAPPAAPPAPGAAAADAGVSAAAAEGPEPAATVRLRGALVHRPVERERKSVEAYLGDAFFLVDDEGRESVLQPTEAHPAAALRDLAGKRVEIEGERHAGELPDPREQHPVMPDGSPMRRGAGILVRALRVIE